MLGSQCIDLSLLFPGKLDEALVHFTEAIICNPHSAILFANRGISSTHELELICMLNDAYYATSWTVLIDFIEGLFVLPNHGCYEYGL